MPRKPDLTLIGRVYNNLRVDDLTDKYNSYGRRLYTCTCLLCGNKKLATKQNLQKGEIKDCGEHKKYKDISGQSFGKLIAVHLSGKKEISNKKIWHCKCACGNETDVSYGDLVTGNTQSCGCLKKEKIKELYVENTSPCKLDSSKIRSTNTSGVTGIWFDKNKNKWCAEITFKKKKYYLGRYGRKADAIAVRKKAEQALFGNFIDWYTENQRTDV